MVQEEPDGTIVYMDDNEIILFQLYRAQLNNGGRSRDDLQHTPECDSLRNDYNEQTGLQLDRREFWVQLQKVLKRGEEHIEEYLTTQQIDFPPK